MDNMISPQQSQRAKPGVSDFKIRIPEKISFVCANLGDIPVMTLIGSFLLIYYTDVVKLDAVAVGILFLVARLMDALCDPLMGFLIDHLPRTRWGRFRPWLAVGSFIVSINFMLLWIGPSMAPYGKLLIAYITYLLMGPTFAFMDISLNSMIPVMTESTKERSSLSALKGLAYMVGMAAVSVVVVPFVAMFPTPKQGYAILIIATCIFIFVMCLIGAAGIRERVVPVKKKRYGVSVMFRIMFRTKPLMVMFISGLLVTAGTMVRQGATIYYLTYNSGDSGLMVPFTMVTLLFAVIGLALSPVFVDHFDKKQVLITSEIICAVGLLTMLPMPYNNVFLLLATNAIVGFGSGGIMALNYSIQADTVDYAEWKHSYRAEGAVVSLASFITKVGQALGGAIPAFVLSMTGYVANAKNQSTGVLQGISLSMTIIPAVLVIAGALVFLSYPITRKVQKEIANDLAKMREAAES